MAEVYVTLGEAAELERVKYNTMVKRVLRKQESFVTKTEKSENGGKDVVLVAVSSLSKQARNAWKEREKLKSFTEEFPDKKEDEQKPEVPWYVNTDVDWYIENYKERYYKAVELGNVVRKFLQYDEGDRTKYAEEFAQKYLGKGQRTLYRYTKAYLEASAWADKLEKEDGAGREFFKVLCLCRKPKETGCFPSIKPEVKQVIKNIWFNEDFARNQGTREMLYEKLTAIANINKWEKIPSYQTVTRYISYLMEDEGMRNAWFLASRGTREYKNKVMVKGSRDTKGLQVMQIVMGDEHTFDCWVSYKQPNGKVIAIKPHLAAWVDMRSRVIMGDVMCKDANNALQVTKGHCFKTEPDAGGNELKFYCCENTVIDAGEPVGRVLVEAEATGTYYNIAPGRITISMIHLDGVDYVTNEDDWLFEEGAEEEDLEDLRDRCMSSWAELATRTIEEKLRNAAKAVPGVLDARIDAQHPRGQGTVDVIVTGAAGEASPELIRKVGEAIEPLKGNYEDYLVKPSEVVRQDFELVIYLAEDAATDGVDAQATKLIEDMMALTRGEMNTLYRDSIIQVLSTKIDNYRKTDILQPSDDMVLEQDKVIMAGDINVTVRNVVQSARGKE